jgi:hypothetical protein
VVGALFVSVVEPLEAQKEEPTGDREEEGYKFYSRRDTVAARTARRDKHVGEQERGDQASHIGNEQHSTNERATAVASTRNGLRNELLLEQ